MRIDVYHHLDPDLERRLFSLITKQGDKIMGTLDTLAADVEANTSASQGMEQVLQTVNQELKDLQNSGNMIDPAALKVITDKIEANTADIVAKTLANTPAAPTA
jgi:hypothetical protein